MTQELALPTMQAWTTPQPPLRWEDHAPLMRCLVLALLLHGLVIAIFGTAPGGSLREGDSLWGAIEVRLGGVGPANSPGNADVPLPYTGPVGRAAEPRWGGEVRQAPPRPSPEPGAAELGTWNPVPALPLAREPAPSLPQAAEPAPVAAPQPTLTRPEPKAPERRDEPAARATTAPPMLDPPARPAPEPAALPSTAPRLAPTETLEAPVLERPKESLREIARPQPAPELPKPAAPPAPQREEPAPAPARPVITAPASPVPPPAPIERLPAVAAPVPSPIPVEVPAAPVSPAVQAPVETPLRAPAAPERVTTPEPTPAPAPAAQAVPVPPPVTPAPAPAAVKSPATTEPADNGGRSTAPATQATRDAEPAPAQRSPAPASDGQARPAAGNPDAGARIGSDRATPPTAPASAPTLNLELPRARGALPSTLGTRGVLNLVPPPPERKSKLAEDIEKAGKTDCRTAYNGMGPLAVVPLAIDAVRNGGCKW